MNNSEKIGSWEVRKWRLKALYPFLTDEDLYLDASNRNEMVRNLRIKLGKSTERELHEVIISL
jgi:uncharacterized protein YbcI